MIDILEDLKEENEVKGDPSPDPVHVFSFTVMKSGTILESNI